MQRLCLRAKDHLRIPGGGLPEPLRPTESPGRQRSGLAATKKWRPGRRRATRLPTEELATKRRQMVGHGQSARERRHLSRRSLWVSTILRAGELSEALFPAQPLRRLRVSSFSPSTRHAWCLLDGHRKSTMDAVVIIGTLPLCIPDGHGKQQQTTKSAATATQTGAQKQHKQQEKQQNQQSSTNILEGHKCEGWFNGRRPKSSSKSKNSNTNSSKSNTNSSKRCRKQQ